MGLGELSQLSGVVELVFKARNWIYSRFRKQYKIWIYGAGRVGKTSLLERLYDPSFKAEEAYFTPSSGSETKKYMYSQEIGERYADYDVRVYTFGGQKDKNEARVPDFLRVRPDAIIYIASPFIRDDEKDEEKRDPLRQKYVHDDDGNEAEFLSVEMMLEKNRESLEELVSIFEQDPDRREKILNNCKFVLPAISHRDMWNCTPDQNYPELFQNKYGELLNRIGKHLSVYAKWVPYKMGDRATIIELIKICLDNDLNS